MKLFSVILFLFISLYSFAEGHLDLTIKPLDAKDGIVSNCWAFVYLDGQKVDMVAGDKIKGLKFELQFDKEYKIELNSKNYEPIEIKVNTTRLSAENKRYVYEYSSKFGLVEKKAGLQPKYQAGNEAKMVIIYSKQKDNFTTFQKYNPVYTYEPIPPKEDPKEKDRLAEEKRKAEELAEQEKAKLATNIEAEKRLAEEMEKAKLAAEKEAEIQDSIAKEEAKIDSIAKLVPEEPIVEKQKEPKLEQPEVIVKTQNPEHLEEQKAKEKAAKLLRIELEKQLLKEEVAEIKNSYIKSKSKRSFLEEISDSKIALKQKERNYQP